MILDIDEYLSMNAAKSNNRAFGVSLEFKLSYFSQLLYNNVVVAD